jgi:dTDP-4-amino-4,6-dideoxygalactose transaminase
MTSYRIPFNKPTLTGREFRYITEALESGQISGDGVFTRRCHALLQEVLGARKVLLTTSCTHALEMCALLLDVQQGDEVILPSFTFVSTVNAFVLRGARPVFSDITADTLNIDPAHVERLVSPRTRAIVPVHYAGIGCEMDALLATARRHGIEVVEDNAHGLFGKYRGRPLGTIGGLGVQSFHETKNVMCGEGGALVINDARYVERAEVIREKGTDRARFFRGEVDKYTWVDVGSSYLPSEVLAAFLYSQLEVADQIQRQRKRVWEFYDEHLRDWASASGVGLPGVPDHCEQAYHMFYLVMPDASARTRLIDHLKARGILSVFHYLPLHLSPMGRRLGGAPGDCPITESVSERLVRLPFYNALTEDEQMEVCAAVTALRVGS